MKTLEDLKRMSPNDVANHAANEMRKSPALRAEVKACWDQLHGELVIAITNAWPPLRAWQAKEKMDHARLAMLTAIVMGHPKEALEAGRRACGLVRVDEETGEPV